MKSTFDYKSLEHKLTVAVNHFAEQLKDDERLRDIYELIEQHGEYGEAYRLLCYLIDVKQVAISPAMYRELGELGAQMGMEDKPWLPLATLTKDA
jgi:hypothetical protein